MDALIAAAVIFAMLFAAIIISGALAASRGSPIEMVKVLSLQPGDVVIFKTKRMLTMEEADRIRIAIESVMPRSDAKAMIISEDADLEIVRAPQ